MGCSNTKVLPREYLEHSNKAVSREMMRGKWHIYETTLPMWLKGDKQRPTLTYDLPDDEADERMYEICEFISEKANGERATIEAYSKRDLKNPSHFKWRGVEGRNFLRTRHWYVVYANHDAGVAAVVFTKGGKCPDGIDILVRDPSRVQAVQPAVQDAKSKLGMMVRFAPLVEKLQPPAGQDPLRIVNSSSDGDAAATSQSSAQSQPLDGMIQPPVPQLQVTDASQSDGGAAVARRE